MSIYVPAIGAESWKGLLADPEKQWQTGYSAKTLAYCWGAAAGLPPEIQALFGPEAALLIGIPEYKVDLPGGVRPSQTDLFALVRRGEHAISCAIEGKVSEPFGLTIQEWLVDASTGKIQRLNYLCRLLGLVQPLAPTLRCQLLHRSASAIIEAARFKTDEAAMIVHSFSTTAIWFDDFAVFIDLFGLKAIRDRLLTVKLPSGLPMHLAGQLVIRTFPRDSKRAFGPRSSLSASPEEAAEPARDAHASLRRCDRAPAKGESLAG